MAGCQGDIFVVFLCFPAVFLSQGDGELVRGMIFVTRDVRTFF